MSNHEGGRDKEKDPASVFQQAEAPAHDVSKGNLDRLWPIDLGEVVAGSEQQIEVPAPRNLRDQPASGQVLVTGSPAMTARWPSGGYDLGKKDGGPIVFTFAPQSPGVFHAALNVHVRWLDGHTEVHTLQVTGRARAIDAAPESGPRQKAQASSSTAPAPSPKAKDRNITVNEVTMKEVLGGAHGRLMDEQREGIVDVADEAKKFNPPPAPVSIWQVLADLAIQIGTAQLAALVSRFVSERIARVIVKAEAAEARAAVAAASKIYEQETERNAAEGPIFPGQSWSVTADMAKDARATQTVTSNVIAASLSGIMTTTAAKLTAHTPDAGAETTQATANVPGQVPASKDNEIAFFSSQRSLNNELREQTFKELALLGGEILKANPETGLDILAGMADALDAAAAGGKAKKVQADATAAEFATYLARTKLGTEDVGTGPGKQTVTNLGPQRAFAKHDQLATPDLAPGMLEVDIDRDITTGAVSVRGAKMLGVSWLTASRLNDLDLRTTGVPLRISVFHGATIITVDEANRVRVGGLPLKINGGSEAEQIPEAKRIVQAVFAKPLSGWGVAIRTNDQRQPREKNAEAPQ